MLLAANISPGFIRRSACSFSARRLVARKRRRRLIVTAIASHHDNQSARCHDKDEQAPSAALVPLEFSHCVFLLLQARWKRDTITEDLNHSSSDSSMVKPPISSA